MADILHFTPDGKRCDNELCDATHARRPQRHRLDNGEMWTTHGGQLLRYEEMTSDHRVNALNMLLSGALIWCRAYWLNVWASPLAPRGDMATWDVEQIEVEAYRNPQAWILETAAGRRLLELVREDGRVGELAGVARGSAKNDD